MGQLLINLQNSVGEQIPHNLTECEKFIQMHPFFADILKPSSIAILVSQMRSSYGHIVKNVTEKQVKKSVKNKQMNIAQELLGDIQI